ncbi:hypothetical protein OESDEN_14947 [Oesophagostomum dentatum]|uniref:Uncharacterized protein n=1 Tax=Oesophagostomum dentatum TaxID=61180 RepID=A0A0B1SK68_OESDE|nr:hypothetical protein OESDEN_14947 [Oesophagostomum dentatum]
MLFPLLCLGALLSISYADFNSTEPIIVSISPKIWTLLKSKDKLIKDAIKSDFSVAPKTTSRVSGLQEL